MKLTTAITAAVLAIAVSVSGHAKPASGRQVNVYCTDNNTVNVEVESTAKILASDIFSKVGVNLRWHYGNPTRPEPGSIVIELVTGTPNDFKPGSLAYALPYEGVHIRIFWGRIKGYSDARQVLAHVMVHEITHILQGEARHSETGIMKAHWSLEEMDAMRAAPLTFTLEDVQLIFAGLDRREAPTSVAAASVAANMTASAVSADVK